MNRMKTQKGRGAIDITAAPEQSANGVFLTAEFKAGIESRSTDRAYIGPAARLIVRPLLANDWGWPRCIRNLL